MKTKLPRLLLVLGLFLLAGLPAVAFLLLMDTTSPVVEFFLPVLLVIFMLIIAVLVHMLLPRDIQRFTKGKKALFIVTTSGVFLCAIVLAMLFWGFLLLQIWR